MKNNNAVAFPLSDCPSYYLACVEAHRGTDCTHVSIQLGPSTLIRLVLMHWIASTLRLIGIKMTVFETRVGTLDVACLKYQGKHFLDADNEMSSDEAPYDCLSLGELASLGGYLTNGVLDKYFVPLKKDTKIYAVDVHTERFSMWLKIYFFGQVLPIETNSFNLDIIVEDYLKRNVQRFSNQYVNQSR